MKKIIILILFTVFSMYCTNICIGILKSKDTLMQKIIENSEKYLVNSEDAKVIENNIIPGKYGKEVDIDKTYSKMKKYGSYNEALTATKEIEPELSIENVYNKYITKGNTSNKNIALIFIINNSDNFNKILKIVNEKKISVTFFIESTLLEENKNIIKNITNHEIELLSNVDESIFKTSISYLKNITDKNIGYCYTEKENEKLLNLCKKLKYHTIKPYLVINNNLLSTLKNNLSNSITITIDDSSGNLNNLAYGIDYITSKGYDLVTIDTLVSERD